MQLSATSQQRSGFQQGAGSSISRKGCISSAQLEVKHDDKENAGGGEGQW